MLCCMTLPLARGACCAYALEHRRALVRKPLTIDLLMHVHTELQLISDAIVICGGLTSPTLTPQEALA